MVGATETLLARAVEATGRHECRAGARAVGHRREERPIAAVQQHRDGASITERARSPDGAGSASIVRASIVGHCQIRPAVAVEVTDGHGVGADARQEGLRRREIATAVAPQYRDNIGCGVAHVARAATSVVGDCEIEVAIAIEVGHGHGDGTVAVADFEGDGNLDLAVANYGSGCAGYMCDTTSRFVSILWGDGRGNFSAPQPLLVGIGPNSVAVEGFNGDGRPDLAVVS